MFGARSTQARQSSYLLTTVVDRWSGGEATMIKSIGTPRRRSLARLGILTTVLCLLVTAVGAPPAQAELLNPRQTWMRNSPAGLFLRWGLRTTRSDPAAPPFTNTDCAAWESEVT